MSYEHTHDFSIPVIGGFLKCSKWKCGAAIRPPTRPAPAVESSPTSVAAAQAIDGPQRHRDRVTVYQAIKSAGASGLVDEEGIEATGIPASTYRPRRVDLVAENVVVNSGLTRLVKSGRLGTVWIIRAEA